MSNNFLAQLKRKQAAAQSEPTQPAEMSEAELDQEIERARADLRRIREDELAAAREAATASPARPRFLPKNRSRRPYWK